MSIQSVRFTIVVVALAGLALFGVAGAPQAQTGPTLSVDTDPSATPANDASTVGSIESCISVASGSPQFDVDITIQGVTSLSGFEADLLYDEAALTVSSMDDNFILATGIPPPFLFNLSDPLPDTDGNNKFHIVLATTGEGGGDGVIIRLSIQPDAAGTSPLTLANVKMKDFDNNPVAPSNAGGFYIGPVSHGSVAVDSSCTTDSDSDGVPDVSDNCVSTPNPLQENSDFDLNAGGASVGGVVLPSDTDGDACDDNDDNDSFDGATLLTQTPGAAATLCPGGAVPLWADCVETYLGTAIDDNCVGTPGPGGDAFPPSTNGDTDVNILDVFPMFPFWLQPVAGPPGTRYDLNTEGTVNILDVFSMFPFWLKSCT